MMVTFDPCQDLTIAHTPGVLDSTAVFKDTESPETGWWGEGRDF